MFEVDKDKEDGSRYAVWSNNFTPTLNERASLRKFLRGWFAQGLTKAGLEYSIPKRLSEATLFFQGGTGFVRSPVVGTVGRSGSPESSCACCGAADFTRIDLRHSNTTRLSSKLRGEGSVQAIHNHFEWADSNMKQWVRATS